MTAWQKLLTVLSRSCLGLVSVLSRSCLGLVSILSWSCLGLVSVLSQSCLGLSLDLGQNWHCRLLRSSCLLCTLVDTGSSVCLANVWNVTVDQLTYSPLVFRFSFFVVVLCFRNLFTYPGKQVEKSDQKGVWTFNSFLTFRSLCF